MTTHTGTFSATAQTSPTLSLAPGQTAEILLTNTGGHPWRVDLEEMGPGDAVIKRTVANYSSDTASTLVENTTRKDLRLRLRCVTLDTDPDTDSVAYSIGDYASTAARTALVCAASAKAGTTAGWVVNAGNNLATLATLPKAITAGTLVVRLPQLKRGDRVVGAFLIGSLQGASTKHTTVLLDIRKLVAATSGATDSSVAAMAAALDVQADTVLAESNTHVATVDHTIVAGESLYALVTATTANDDACTATLLAVVLLIVPA